MSDLSHRHPIRSMLSQKHYGSLWSTLLLAAILVTGPLVLGGARTWILLPIYGAVAALLLFQALRLWLGRPDERRRMGDAIDLLVLLFVGYAFFLYWTIPVGFVARVEMFNIVVYAIVFWFCRYGILSVNHMLLLLIILLLAASGITVFAFFLWKNPEWLPYGSTLHQHYYPRLCGTYGCPNHYGYLAALAAAIAGAFLLFSRLSWVWSIICVYLGVMLAAGVFLTLSRGSWIALAVAGLALTVLAVRAGNMKWYLPVVGFVVLLGIGVSVVASSPKMWNRVEMAIRYFEGIEGEQAKRDITSYVRYELAMDSFRIFQDYPVFGTGPASFDYVHQRYQDSDYGGKAIHTHNDYLNALTDYGAIGAALILGFILLVSWRLWQFPAGMAASTDLVVLGSVWAMWGAILAHSVVDFNMHIPGNALIVFALAGVGLNLTQRLQKRTLWLPAARLLKPLAVVSAVAALLLGGLAFWTGKSYYTYLEVNQQKEVRPFPESMAKLKAAAANDPYNENIPSLLGDLYRVQAAQVGLTRDIELQSELAQAASNWYRQAGELAPLNDHYMLLRAQVHDQMYRFDEAYLMYQRAIDMRPYNGYYRFLLGRHFLKRGLVDQARDAFETGAKSAHGRDYNKQMLRVMRKVDQRQKKAEKAARKAERDAKKEGKEPEQEPPVYDPVTLP